MLPTEDLAMMRAAQNSHMPDICCIQARVSTPTSGTNKIVDTWPTDSAEITCGLDMRPGNMRHSEKFTAITYDATLRLPLGTLVKANDRVKITKRFGETLSVPLIYSVMSPVQQGPSAIRIVLQRVEI